ncbi:hypothetical protein [Tetragenococcus muriaticus]|uniref:hypothetical protein n=1 Tax=Tetragenococcus muriaticus TaxID=64642 RepID=UPI0012DCD28C|nr:hypothetical protein [Tetragenococcus muriaticus]
MKALQNLDLEVLIVNQKQAALFLYLLEDLVFDRDFLLQQSVVFEVNGRLITGEFFSEESFFAPFISPEDQYAFKESFVSRTMPYNGVTDYNKPQIQNDLQKDLPSTFEKMKSFILDHKKYPELEKLRTTIADDAVIQKVQFLELTDQTFPFFIFPKESTFEPVSLLFELY